MKKISTVLLLFICSVLVVSSQNKFDNALLWKISGNGLEKPSYILGTHHLANISFLDSISGFKDAYTITERVVGEIVLTPDLMAEMQLKMQKAALMPDGESYQQMLSAEEYNRLNEGLISLFKVGLSSFGQLKPGMISNLYSIMLYSLVDPNFKPLEHEAIDLYIQRIAVEHGKTILGLETVEDQLHALFDSEPLKDQTESLICGLENIEWGKKTLIDLDRFYKEQSLSKLYDVALNNEEDPCPMSLKQVNALNRDRNNKWLDKLPEIMKEKSNLIVVGALHLGGSEGLLYQLSEMGYIIEAVK